MNSLQDYSFVDILPHSLTKDPFVVALAEAIEIEIKQVYRELEQLSNFMDVDKLPEALLDYLAYQKHVDFYENDLPIEQKRGLIKNSIPWHRKKGTPWAVEQVVSIIFEKAKTMEWFDYEGDPYKFRIETESVLKNPNDYNRLVQMIDATKNKRSHLENVTIKRTNNSELFFGGIISTRNKIQILPTVFKIPNLNHTKYFSGVISTRTQTTIKMG